MFNVLAAVILFLSWEHSNTSKDECTTTLSPEALNKNLNSVCLRLKLHWPFTVARGPSLANYLHVLIETSP